ncbi:MAG: N-6 DNA methylase [Acidimicrobiales bacterium]
MLSPQPRLRGWRPMPARRPPADAGAAHQARLAARRAQALGAYCTPPALVAGVVDLALGPVLDRAAGGARRHLRPAHRRSLLRRRALPRGGGERLLGALSSLGIGGDEVRRRVAESCLHGIDVDPTAVRLARGALRELGGEARAVARRIVEGDALHDASLLRPESFGAVIGNPPFLSQLGAATARAPERTAALRSRFGAAVAAYTDPAAAFLLAGLDLARPDGGAVALVEPVSALTARDAGGVRAAVVERAQLHDLWVVGDGGFDAAVEVCVPVLVRPAAGGPARTRLHRGLGRAAAGEASHPAGSASWSALLAGLEGVRAGRCTPPGCSATSPGPRPTSTSTTAWRPTWSTAPRPTARPTRRWSPSAWWTRPAAGGASDPPGSTRCGRHPRVDRVALPDALRSWADARLVPKVLLATQTRAPEAVVDAAGRLLPSVPLISVVPHEPDDLWRIAVVLTCPAVALVAVERHLGSGRNARALRLRAAEVLELPLPAGRGAWAARRGCCGRAPRSPRWGGSPMPRTGSRTTTSCWSGGSTACPLADQRSASIGIGSGFVRISSTRP